jgi:hypothetical protein
MMTACSDAPKAASAPSFAQAAGAAAAAGVAGSSALSGSGALPAAVGGAGAPSAGPSAGSSAANAGAGGALSAAAGSAAAGASSAAGAHAGGTGGVAGAAGAAGATQAGEGGGGGVPGSGKVFSQCRMHFGTTDGIAKNNPAMIKELDFFTPGWMGLKDSFDMQYVCDYTKPGGMFAAQVPAIVSYAAAFYAKRIGNLKDCNAPGSQQDLCVAGARIIQQNLSNILAIYESYAAGFAGCYGTTRPIIFMMEPDFYQYTLSGQSAPWSAAQAGQIMGQLVAAIKKHLPNAVFSLDVSPWVAPNNGEDNGKQWFSNFDMKAFTFINTSGGGTDAATATIRSANKMTWRGVSEVTGKPLLADTGYGVNGQSAGPDAAWDNPANINARVADGVVSISQYNPASNWGTTIANLRSQLKAPRVCP